MQNGVTPEVEIRTVTTLQHKRDQIQAAILCYEAKLTQARADLSAIRAAIKVFENYGTIVDISGYTDLYRLFRRRESTEMSKEALREFGPMTTSQLARVIAEKKGLDANDGVLLKAIGLRLVHALAIQVKTGRMLDAGRVRNVRIWALPDQALQIGKLGSPPVMSLELADDGSGAARKDG